MKLQIIALLIFVLTASCSHFSKQTFKKLSPSRTGIDFKNILVENDTLNYTKFPYMYMGGGISVGDINNDGLDDIFFTGNLVPNRLYLNKGNMRFEDISEKAGIMGNHQWFTGSTMADVNNDGWLDIYVCVSGKYQPSDNLLFINNKDNTFTESAKTYGINDKSSSVQATFFDYNNDGYLDLYVANYPIVLVSMGADFYHDKIKKNDFEESGHLYKNNGNGTFSNVTDEAGVRNFGMSIGVVAMDFNNDGWKDLYISNDFNPPDYLYLNQGNGTFKEVIKKATFQTSIFGMGFDAADINNDGLLDMYQIDMTPPGHQRRMVNVIPMRQETFNNSVQYGFHYQYMQNSLQLNNGVFDSVPVFSNISLFAGVAYTDWSWGGLFMDIDNDGNKDLFVSNGVLRDINNQDVFLNPRENMYFGNQNKEYRPELFPSTPVQNMVFRNSGDLTFSNQTENWGFKDFNLTNGVSYGDFDNDGDLDLVIHNVNEISSIYENKVVDRENHYLKIKLNGPAGNSFGLGSIVTVKTGNITQKQELTLTRGYQSSVPAYIHFGFGKTAVIDSLTITWPDGKKQTMAKINTNQTITLKYNDARAADKKKPAAAFLFTDITSVSGINFTHHEVPFNDFAQEPLLPYKYSQLGPGLAVGDLNGDGLDDFFVGNGEKSAAAAYIQQKNGTFKETAGPWIADSLYEDTGALIFDANGDSLNDIIVISGGNDNKRLQQYYHNRIYMNTGKGFKRSETALPDLAQSSKCVESADYDHDGDMDLFIGGRNIPGGYPLPASSVILTNNGKKGDDLRFENLTGSIAPVLNNAGMVTGALWNDFDRDGDLDLIFTGEWMNIRFLQNDGGKFTEITEKLGLGNNTGWWYSLFAADIDNDGDEDYIAGNLGLNYKYHENEGFEVYSNDFDVNGKNDIVFGYTQDGINYPANSFYLTSQQIPMIKNRYATFAEFGKATLQEIYGEKVLEKSLHYKINTFASIWIENKGKGVFAIHRLPNRAQLSSINSIAEVKNNKNNLFVIAGNLYETEAETPRNDAGIGLVLQYAQNHLNAIAPDQSGLFVRGEVREIQSIRLASGKTGLLFAINNGPLKLIEVNEGLNGPAN